MNRQPWRFDCATHESFLVKLDENHHQTEGPCFVAGAAHSPWWQKHAFLNEGGAQLEEVAWALRFNKFVKLIRTPKPIRGDADRRTGTSGWLGIIFQPRVLIFFPPKNEQIGPLRHPPPPTKPSPEGFFFVNHQILDAQLPYKDRSSGQFQGRSLAARASEPSGRRPHPVRVCRSKAGPFEGIRSRLWRTRRPE